MGDVHVSAMLCVIPRGVFEMARQHGWNMEEGQQPPSATHGGARRRSESEQAVRPQGRRTVHSAARRPVGRWFPGAAITQASGPELTHSAFRPPGRTFEVRHSRTAPCAVRKRRPRARAEQGSASAAPCRDPCRQFRECETQMARSGKRAVEVIA